MNSTGLGSRIAAARSPFASSGVDGATTFSPGDCRNHASGFCEWNGPPEKPPPDGSRTTIGTGTPWRLAICAATFTSWSKPHEMKSANCISHTGRMPSMAAPTAVPMIADSASGVSHTRSPPNSSMKPSVILNAPPKAPMSSPRQNTESSARISSPRPSEMACRYVISGMSRRLPRGRPARPRGLPVAELRVRVGEDAFPSGVGVGHGLLECPGRLALQLLAHRLAPRRPRRVRVDPGRRELLLVALDRVAARPHLEHLLRHVALVVVGTVPVHAHGHGLDERRALAAACSLARLGRGLEHGLHVVAVHLHAREAVAGGALDRV